MKPITIEWTINAPIEKVWDSRNNPSDITQRAFAADDRHCPNAINDLKVWWKFSYTMAAKDGSMSFEYNWYYTAIDLHKKIEFTLWDFPQHDIPEDRKVSVIFEKLDDNTTKVIETFDPEEINSEELQKAWRQMILNNFKKHTEKSEKINESTW